MTDVFTRLFAPHNTVYRDHDEQSILELYAQSTWPITPPETPTETPDSTPRTYTCKRSLELPFLEAKAKRGKRSLDTQRSRRKSARKRKKKDKVGEMIAKSVFERWKERGQCYQAGIEADIEEERRQHEIEKQIQAEKEAQVSLEKAQRYQAAEVTDNLYNQEVISQASTSSHHNTRPLLLEAVLTPVIEEHPCDTNYHQLLHEARKERDYALITARQWRDKAESAQAEKRKLKNEMEKTVEVVRDFWRNKVVEGESRSGKILRAALIRN